MLTALYEKTNVSVQTQTLNKIYFTKKDFLIYKDHKSRSILYSACKHLKVNLVKFLIDNNINEDKETIRNYLNENFSNASSAKQIKIKEIWNLLVESPGCRASL